MTTKEIDGRKESGARRRQSICELLLQKGYVDVGELGRQLGVNVATIRRDLERLEGQGALRRVHGGAYAHSTQQGVEIDFSLRMSFHAEAKRRIARRTAALITEGDTVYLDAGTTACMVAEELAHRRSIVVVTHSLAAAETLQSSQGIDLYVVGGRHFALTRSLVGPVAEEAIHAFRFRKMILATAGIDYKSRALTMSAMEEVPIKRAAMSQTEQVILVADQSKFGKPSLISMIPLAAVQVLVTDAHPAEEAAGVLSALGIELIIASG